MRIPIYQERNQRMMETSESVYLSKLNRISTDRKWGEKVIDSSNLIFYHEHIFTNETTFE